MAEYIEREKIFSIWKSIPAPASVVSLSAAIHQTPAADVVSRAVYEQTAWERDIAMEQLAAHGIGFGEECEAAAFASWKYCPNCGARMDKGADHPKKKQHGYHGKKTIGHGGS